MYAYLYIYILFVLGLYCLHRETVWETTIFPSHAASSPRGCTRTCTRYAPTPCVVARAENCNHTCPMHATPLCTYTGRAGAIRHLLYMRPPRSIHAFANASISAEDRTSSTEYRRGLLAMCSALAPSPSAMDNPLMHHS